MTRILVTVVLGLAFAASALAEDRVDQRQGNQDQRIDQGAAKGSLNEAEENRLERGQKRIDRMEQRAEKDGNVSNGEARRLERAQDQQSRKIRRLKNNRR